MFCSERVENFTAQGADRPSVKDWHRVDFLRFYLSLVLLRYSRLNLPYELPKAYRDFGGFGASERLPLTMRYESLPPLQHRASWAQFDTPASLGHGYTERCARLAEVREPSGGFVGETGLPIVGR